MRKSQTKFETSALTLDIASHSGRPIRMFLNRPLIMLLEHLGVERETFISLQKNAKSCPHNILDWTSDLHDMADTADLVAALDLVISIDSSVAHLTGALGRPIWLMDRFDGCWRWMKNRPDSPWYPTMRIFRQPTPGDWDAVVRDVGAALAAALA